MQGALRRRLTGSRKDKTLVFMLDALQRIEAKVNQIGKAETGAYESSLYTTPPSGRLPSIGSALQQSQPQSPLNMEQSQGHRTPNAQISSSHKVLLWPFIHARLAEFNVDVAEDLQALTQEGTPWFLHHELRKHPGPLPADVRLESEPTRK